MGRLIDTFFERYPKLYRTYRYYYHRMFPRRRTPHEVAMSVFLGVFIGVLPTIGIAIPLTVLACHLSKVPKIPGVLSSFIAIPPTLFFFFYPLGMAFGVVLLSPPPIEFNFLEKFAELNLGNFLPTIKFLLQKASGHFYAFSLGITLVALITAFVFYFISLFVMKKKNLQNFQALKTKRQNS